MNYGKMGYLKAEEAINLANRIASEKASPGYLIISGEGSGIFKVETEISASAALIIKLENVIENSEFNLYINGKLVRNETFSGAYAEKTLFAAVNFNAGENDLYISSGSAAFECLITGSALKNAESSAKLLTVYGDGKKAAGILYGGNLTVSGDYVFDEEGILDFALAVNSGEIIAFVIDKNNDLYLRSTTGKIKILSGVNKIGAVSAEGNIYAVYMLTDGIYFSPFINRSLAGREKLNFPKNIICDIRGCSNYPAFLFRSQTGANYLKMLEVSNETNGVMHYVLTSSYSISF